MFRFDSAERTNREPAAGVSLQVFDVGSGSVAGFLERLHRAMAIFAAHDFSAFCERFEDRAWQPAPMRLHLALRHHRRFFLHSHGWIWMPSNQLSAYVFSDVEAGTRSECASERVRVTEGKVG